MSIDLKKSFVLFFVLCFVATPLYAEVEYEYIKTDYRKWSVSSNLWCYNNDMDLLNIYNPVAKTEEAERNKTFTVYDSEFSFYYFDDDLSGERAFEIKFNLMNKSHTNNYKYKTYQGKKEIWYDENIYYGFSIVYEDEAGRFKKYTVFYCDSKNGGCSYHKIVNGVEMGWQEYYSYLYYNDITVLIYYYGGGTLFVRGGGDYEQLSFSRLHKIIIHSGTASDIVVSDFEIKRKTNKSLANRYYEKAVKLCSNEEYSKAIENVDKGLEYNDSFDLVFLRSYCSFLMGEYKSALEYLDWAAKFSVPINKEEVYYLRGLCKLSLQDISGAIEDLKKAGEEGMKVIEENNLLENNQQVNNKDAIEEPSSRKYKPALKK